MELGTYNILGALFCLMHSILALCGLLDQGGCMVNIVVT